MRETERETPFCPLFSAGLQRVNSHKWITARTAVRGDHVKWKRLRYAFPSSISPSRTIRVFAPRARKTPCIHKLVKRCAVGPGEFSANSACFLAISFITVSPARGPAHPRALCSPAAVLFKLEPPANTPQHPPRNRRDTSDAIYRPCPATLSNEINLPPGAHEERDVEQV